MSDMRIKVIQTLAESIPGYSNLTVRDLVIEFFNDTRESLNQAFPVGKFTFSRFPHLNVHVYENLAVILHILGFQVTCEVVGVERTFVLSIQKIPSEFREINFSAEGFLNKKLNSYTIEELQEFAKMIVSDAGTFQSDGTTFETVFDQVENFLIWVREGLSQREKVNNVYWFCGNQNNKYTDEAFKAILIFLGFEDIVVEFISGSIIQAQARWDFVPLEISNPIIFNAESYLKDKLDIKEKNGY